jgi:hypothetical protein
MSQQMKLYGWILRLKFWFALDYLFKVPPRSDINISHISLVFIVVIAIGSIAETVVAQLLPFKLLTVFGIRDKRLIYISMVIAFATLHVSSGIGSVVVAGIIGGMFLAFAYLRWSEVSLWKAFFAALCCHFIYDSVLTLIIVVAKFWHGVAV